MKDNATGRFIKTHGKSRTSEYKIYQGILARCYNENDNSYYNYGKRGIKVCDRWLESFENFYEDMGDKPGPNYSIDRINSNGDYCKENCKWSTDKEQGNNRKTNKFLEYNGERLTYSQWEDKLGFRKGTIKSRITKWKWSIERTLTTPVAYRSKRKPK